MGTLIHGYGGAGYAIEDRKLSHIKVLVGVKLSHAESFYLSWDRYANEGSGRVSIWVSPATPIQFRFIERDRPEINRQWIEYMLKNSFGPRGVVIVDEAAADLERPLSHELL